LEKNPKKSTKTWEGEHIILYYNMTTATKRFISRKLAELNEVKVGTSKDIKELDEELQRTHGEGYQQRSAKAEEVRLKTKVIFILSLFYTINCISCWFVN